MVARRRAQVDEIAGMGPVREVAVLADGPWAPRCYWRDDLEAMQEASRRVGYPDDHPSAVLRRYEPTGESAIHQDGAARVWRYRAVAGEQRIRSREAA